MSKVLKVIIPVTIIVFMIVVIGVVVSNNNVGKDDGESEPSHIDDVESTSESVESTETEESESVSESKVIDDTALNNSVKDKEFEDFILEVIENTRLSNIQAKFSVDAKTQVDEYNISVEYTSTVNVDNKLGVVETKAVKRDIVSDFDQSYNIHQFDFVNQEKTFSQCGEDAIYETDVAYAHQFNISEDLMLDYIENFDKAEEVNGVQYIRSTLTYRNIENTVESYLGALDFDEDTPVEVKVGIDKDKKIISSVSYSINSQQLKFIQNITVHELTEAVEIPNEVIERL